MTSIEETQPIKAGSFTVVKKKPRSTDANANSLLHLKSVERITSYPIVHSALGIAIGVYEKVKDSNRVVGWTLTKAEDVGVAVLVPVANRLGTPIHIVDKIMCFGIDIVEHQVPAIKMTPEQLLDGTKLIVAHGLGLNPPNKKPSLTARAVGLGIGVTTIGLNHSVELVERYLDNYHPETKWDDVDKPSEEVPEPYRVLRRWHMVSRRLQLVVINSAKQQRDDIANFLKRVGQFINDIYPKMVDNVVMTYEEIARTVTDPKMTKMAKASRVAAIMAQFAVQVVNDVSTGIAKLPGEVIHFIGDAQKCGLDILRTVLLENGTSSTTPEPVKEATPEPTKEPTPVQKEPTPVQKEPDTCEAKTTSEPKPTADTTQKDTTQNVQSVDGKQSCPC